MTESVIIDHLGKGENKVNFILILPPPPPLTVPTELLVQALEMQARLLELRGYMRVALEVLARLLVLRSLEWRHVCLVSGWVWAVGKERC